MGIHDGHRKRVKERFRQEGLDNFSPINVLELLLFYSIPRINTNDIAHSLLEHFGSFVGVMDAPVEELEKVPGMGNAAATFLSLVSSVSRYYHLEQGKGCKDPACLEDFAKILVPKFLGSRDEYVYLLCLDPKGKMICCRLVGKGTVCSTNVSIRKIAEIALSVNATSVILAHNHPNGQAIPSMEDIRTTTQIGQALKKLDIFLADHMIVAGDKYISLAEMELYKPENE